MTRPLAVHRTLVLALVAGLAAGACTSRQVQPQGQSSSLAGMAPMLSVERFLQAANARDYDAMVRLFGTADGPIEGDPNELEYRMATIAEILEHEDYRIVSEERAPGRKNPTNRVGVTLTKNGRLIRNVPFMVVQTEEGGWLVEQIDLAKITGS